MPLMRDSNRERGLPRLTVTVPEAAEILGCSKTHLYALVARGEIPTVPHMGRRRLIPRTAIDRLLEPEA
jgi:excisionase family DNA binding protein